MNLAGTTLSFPVRPDVRGSMVSLVNRGDIVAQAIADIVETRRGERVMLPDYGIDDFVFAVQDSSFAIRLAAHLEEQITKYVPLVKSLEVNAATDGDGRAIVEVQYVEVGQVNAPRNLVCPVWQLQQQGVFEA
jgi:phage baseplate assembly protein W